MAVKKRGGIVYSTNPDFKPEEETVEEQTLPPSQQLLYVWIDSKNRSGKTVTLIKGFRGSAADLNQLSTALKRHCGTGGSAKNGEIIIQGNVRDKVIAWLNDNGYKTKRAGG